MSNAKVALGSIYYTLRVRTPNDHVDLAKWDSLRSEPLEVYRMSLKDNVCSCPSPKTPCKHQPIKHALWGASSDGARPHLLAYYEDEGIIVCTEDMKYAFNHPEAKNETH